MARKAKKNASKKLPDQKFYWHFMRSDGKLSYNDERKPKLGQSMKFALNESATKWIEAERRHVKTTTPVLCGQGMHGALKLNDRVDSYYTPGIRLARVELGKIYDSDEVKAVSDKRRIVELWTPLKVRTAILRLAQEAVATGLKKELKWWLDNCPFEEVRVDIKSGNMERFKQYKNWLSLPVPYGPPVPLGSIEGGFHPFGEIIWDGHREDSIKRDLCSLEEEVATEKRIPSDYRGQLEIDLLKSLFRDGLTEKKFLEVLGPGRTVKK